MTEDRVREIVREELAAAGSGAGTPPPAPDDTLTDEAKAADPNWRENARLCRGYTSITDALEAVRRASAGPADQAARAVRLDIALAALRAGQSVESAAYAVKKVAPLVIEGCPPSPPANSGPAQAGGFRIGDVVQLNSGGPGMTVTGISPRGRVQVEFEWTPEWYAGLTGRIEGVEIRSVVEEMSFPPSCLRVVPPTAPS